MQRAGIPVVGTKPLHSFYMYSYLCTCEQMIAVGHSDCWRIFFGYYVLVLGKFGLRLTQTGFEPNPNRLKWFGFGESWLKLNGLVSGLGVPNLVQTKSNQLRKNIKKYFISAQ